MRVIADITPHAAKSRHVVTAYTIAEMRVRCQEASDGLGVDVTAEIYRMPDVSGDPYGLDVPTWRIIRTPEQFIRSESFSPGS